ncbi:MAG: hypothetical protein JKY52_07830 [Flavobacteriales bacterium]|nr:hypothetical protein [Flavobacteriales bacterium]
MKGVIGIILIMVSICGCLDSTTHESKNPEYVISEVNKTSFIDSLKAVCHPNSINDFDIEILKTDDFSAMTPISKKLFQVIYPNREDFSENSFFIYSFLPTNNDYLTLITYQKNYEGENYRVDYIDMVNIDSTGKQLDRIRLAANHNEVITYEFSSFLTHDTLRIIERISTEPYFDPDLDTLFTNKYIFMLNGDRRIDTLEIQQTFEVRID